MENTIYTLEDTINFGKYNGKTLRSIMDENIFYIYWCIENVETFALSEQSLEELKSRKQSTQKVYNLNSEKLERFSQSNNDDSFDSSYDDYDDYDNPWEDYGNSYEEFGGYNGWDDDTIYDAFDGDPEATWNID